MCCWRLSVIQVMVIMRAWIRATGLLLGSWRRFTSHLKGFFSSELDGGECQLISREGCCSHICVIELPDQCMSLELLSPVNCLPAWKGAKSTSALVGVLLGSQGTAASSSRSFQWEIVLFCVARQHYHIHCELDSVTIQALIPDLWTHNNVSSLIPYLLQWVHALELNI